MQTLKSFMILPTTNEAVNSDVFDVNSSGGASDITLEVFGDATGFVVELQGKCEVEKTNFWSPITVINLTDFSAGQTMTASGIYTTNIAGLSQIRVAVTSITTGNIDVYCKITA